jgi:hypothetical protein
VVWTHAASSVKNSWVLLQGPDIPWADNLVWCQLYPAGESFSFINMYSTFISAKQMNTIVDVEIFDNTAAGTPPTIFQVYGW